MFARSSGRRAAAALAAALALAPGRADAADGFYAGVALQSDRAVVDYRKTVGIDAPPPTAMTAADRRRESVTAVAALAGYRRAVSADLYLAGEVEGAFHFGGVEGELRGTGDGDRDVWPGEWTLEKRRSLGVNARAGWRPGDRVFPGAEGSLFLFAGLRRTGAEFKAAHRNARLGIASSRRGRDTLASWTAGAGFDLDAAGGRFDFRVGYAAGEVDFRFPAAGPGDPRLAYAFELREWRVSLAWVVPLGE